MGCEGSKDAPSGSRPQARYDPPPRQPTYQPQQSYREPSYAAAQPVYTPPQPSHRSGYDASYNQHTLAVQELQEVQRTRAAIHRANSIPSYHTPPPQQPSYQPAYHDTGYYQQPAPPLSARQPAEPYEQTLQRANTARLLNEQRYATVDQLHEVYPNLDREVIRGVINDCQGDQERCHTVLSELSGNHRAGSPPLGRSMSGSPNRRGICWEVGAAVDAKYQGQWYTAVVEGVENNGDYRVKWTSDGSSTLVTPDDLRPRQGLTAL